MDTKERFLKLLKEKGYSNLRQFCVEVGIDYPNMDKRVKGVRQKIEIGFMFKLANLLHVPIEDIIEIFYYDEWITNRAMLNENDLTIKRE